MSSFVIENVSAEFVPVFKALVKASGARLSQSKTPSRRLLAALEESEKIAQSPEKYPSFKTAAEVLADCRK